MRYEYQRIDLGPIEQMRALRRLFGADRAISNETLAAVSQLQEAQRVQAGTQLTLEGAPSEHLFFVIDGELHMTREGRDMGTFGPSSGVGAIAGFAQDPVGFTCIATQDSTLLTLRVTDLYEMLEDHFELLHSSLVNMAAGVIELRRTLLPSAGFSGQIREKHPFCGEHALGLVERMIHLRHTIGLEQSYVDELAELARAATEVRYSQSSTLWLTGDAASYLVIVVSGEVHARSREGAEFRFGPGDIVGNLDTIAGVPRWFDARAVRDTVALTLDSEAIVDVWEDHPALGFAFLRLLARLLLALRVQFAELQPPSAAASP
jgi:CRP-like cAMP-binding protein